MPAPLLIVTQALVSHQDGVTLHPDLLLWQRQFAKRRQRWFRCTDRTPVEWFAALIEADATALLAHRIEALPVDTSQCWSVTPYHARLARETVRIYPEGMFNWSAADAAWLCDTLNPLLEEEGMSLHHHGSALLLACRDALDAAPLSFAAISGKLMPNRHHEGADGGRVSRLLSEIQMVLHREQPPARRERGEVEISGLWLSAPVFLPQAEQHDLSGVATRNPALAAIVDGRDAKVIISEAERLSELVKEELPKTVILTGEGYALLLNKLLLPRFNRITLHPKAPKNDSELVKILASYRNT